MNENRVSLALFFLRISVFLVMLMWTLDKFVRPEHAARVYEHFYFIGGLSDIIFYGLAAIELVILLAFVAGLFKRLTYGAVLIFHAVSTLSTYKIYLDPFADGPNLLFFAAWPMLAACFALYYLRDQDTSYTLSK